MIKFEISNKKSIFLQFCIIAESDCMLYRRVQMQYIVYTMYFLYVHLFYAFSLCGAQWTFSNLYFTLFACTFHFTLFCLYFSLYTFWWYFLLYTFLLLLYTLHFVSIFVSVKYRNESYSCQSSVVEVHLRFVSRLV